MPFSVVFTADSLPLNRGRNTPFFLVTYAFTQIVRLTTQKYKITVGKSFVKTGSLPIPILVFFNLTKCSFIVVL